MTIESLSSAGIEGADKQVQPNFKFVIAAFCFIIAFNFLFVSGFAWLAQNNAAKTKQGTGSIANIYYDKVADQERLDHLNDGLCSCFTRMF